MSVIVQSPRLFLLAPRDFTQIHTHNQNKNENTIIIGYSDIVTSDCIYRLIRTNFGSGFKFGSLVLI
jgi:hypothetical protein